MAKRSACAPTRDWWSSGYDLLMAAGIYTEIHVRIGSSLRPLVPSAAVPPRGIS